MGPCQCGLVHVSVHVFALREGQTCGNRTTVSGVFFFSEMCHSVLLMPLLAAVDDNDESPFNFGAGQLAQEAMDERSRKEEKESGKKKEKSTVSR